MPFPESTAPEPVPSELPLRERKRLETATAIRVAARALISEHGIGSVTVDQIAAQAEVSPRTFFNYYATKEDAALGVQEPSIPEDALQRFRDGESDLFTTVVSLIATLFDVTGSDAELLAERMRLVHTHPELQQRMQQHFVKAESLVMELVTDAIERGDERLSALPGGVDAVHAVVMLAGTALRFAYKHGSLEAGTDRAAAIAEAVELFRKVTQATL